MVTYFSTHMVLYPGDLIATGTPPGVGFGKNKFMAVGDVLECGIGHLGAQRHEIRRRRRARLFRPRPAVGMRKTKGETIDLTLRSTTQGRT